MNHTMCAYLLSLTTGFLKLMYIAGIVVVYFYCSITFPYVNCPQYIMLVTHCSVLSNSFATPWTQAIRLLCPWNFSSKNTTVGCHFLLQGIFPAQGSKLCLLQWQADSLPLSHLGSPGCLLSSTIFFHFIYDFFSFSSAY